MLERTMLCIFMSMFENPAAENRLPAEYFKIFKSGFNGVARYTILEESLEFGTHSQRGNQTYADISLIP